MSAPRATPADIADRLIVALDVPSVAQARELVARLRPVVRAFKIGHWLGFAEGSEGFLSELVRAGLFVFLDCKLFDIGQTVEQGVARIVDRGVAMITVHSEPAIVAAAVRGRAGSDLKVFAVSVLTNLDDAALQVLGYRHTVAELVAQRARIAVQHGADGLICSALDHPDQVRQQSGSDRLLIATPGIRPAGAAQQDQLRVATPASAILAGADYLVVGRPIIGADDPACAAAAIVAEMQAARAV